jgi:hypothetical protein
MTTPAAVRVYPDQRLTVQPIALRAARRYIAENHRHNLAPKGWLFGCAVAVGGEIVGVGVAGRPVARGLQDGQTVEITRVCTDGTRNACSCLYGALTRAAFALGYVHSITYTLASEPGSSLRAAGFTIEERLPARSGWSNPGRLTTEVDLFGEKRTPFDQDKLRWGRWA